MITANIHHIIRLRINSDGDGVRSVVFVHGCPLNCFWCCNPETRFTSSYKKLTTKELKNYIVGDKPYFVSSGGGVTFCGGEPLLYSSFIEEYIEEYCQGFSVNIETSLYAEQEKISALIPLINEWYVDFKVFDDAKHTQYTGKSNRIIKDNLAFLSQIIKKDKIIITFPLVVNYNTSDQDMDEMITFLKGLGIYRIALHPYRKEAEEKQKKLGLTPTNVSEVNSELYQSVIIKFVENGFEIVERNILLEKEKCSFLKHLRKTICDEKDINIEIKECDFKERCTGTCPQCEYELSVINNHLNIKSCNEE